MGLRVKLALAFVSVAVTATLLSGFLANRVVHNEFDVFVTRRGQQISDRIIPALQAYYGQTGSWVGIEEMFTPPPVRGRPGPGGNSMFNNIDARSILTDEHSTVLYDSEATLAGHQLPQELVAAARPIHVNGKDVGLLFVGRVRDNVEQRGFLRRVNRALLLGGIAAGGLAIVLAGLLASQMLSPLKQLVGAARGIAAGRLDQRVTVAKGDELGELGEAFNRMSEALGASEAQRRIAMADIAHELRNPLSSIRANLEGMVDGTLPAEPERIAMVYDQTLLLGRLVEDLRLLTIARAGELPLHRQPTDLIELTRQVSEIFQALGAEKGVSVQVQTQGLATGDAALSALPLDQQRISQVLANLLSNAVKHAPPSSAITVVLAKQEAVAQVSVADTGPGIAPEDLPRIFERFYRTEESRRELSPQSTGLGLAIAKELVEAHGGRIWVESTPGQGAVFRFTLPLAPSTEVQPRQAAV